MQKIVGNSILDRYFDDGTMSVHIKESVKIKKKKGGPGVWLVEETEEVLKVDEMNRLIDAIFHEIEERDDGYMEIDRGMFKIVQLGPYRIVIVYRPLADGLEMTIVKPIKKLSLADYQLDSTILELLENEAQGVLIAGAPGSGKTTFAQAVIEMHQAKKKIVKTIESPRDLLVDDEIVQYSFSYGSHNDLRDILLLSRPDFTVYDELRNVDDFLLFKDLRLTGIGLLGVIHATKPIDSIQRFLGHVELGIIPQMIDTVIYIDKGKIGSIYQLALTVKVPAGMESDDLARPVVLVHDFADKKVCFEIYSFGEQIVVMPLDAILSGLGKEKAKGGMFNRAQESLQKELGQLFDFDFLVSVKDAHSVNLYIPERYKGSVIGKNGQKIHALEEALHVKITLKSFSELPFVAGVVDTHINKEGTQLELTFDNSFVDKKVCLLVDDELIHFTVTRRARIIISDKGMMRKMQKNGYVVVDLEHM